MAFFFGLRSIEEPRVRRIRSLWVIFAFLGVVTTIGSAYYLIEMVNHHTTYYRAKS
jgi:hypothetical protein